MSSTSGNDPYTTILQLLDKDEKDKKYFTQDEQSTLTDKIETKKSLLPNPDIIIPSSIEENLENQDATDTEDASSEDVLQQNNIEAPDTLDSLLNFLKTSGSPVSGLLDLRSLLLEQKEEKVMLRTLVDQMKVDIAGLR